MSIQFLDFEQPIAELEAKIEELRLVNQGGEFDVGIEEEITRLRTKSAELTGKIFSNLGAWQISQCVRTHWIIWGVPSRNSMSWLAIVLMPTIKPL